VATNMAIEVINQLEDIAKASFLLFDVLELVDEVDDGELVWKVIFEEEDSSTASQDGILVWL